MVEQRKKFHLSLLSLLFLLGCFLFNFLLLFKVSPLSCISFLLTYQIVTKDLTDTAPVPEEDFLLGAELCIKDWPPISFEESNQIRVTCFLGPKIVQNIFI